MSHPLLVEAIEDQFVPFLVYNNKGGEDAKFLKHFREPSWNNPIIRYLDNAEKDLIPRKDLVLSVGETAQRMAAALKQAKREVPAYLSAVAAGTKSSQLATATFSMY